MKSYLASLFLLLVFFTQISLGQKTEAKPGDPSGMPAWLLNHFTLMIEGSGVWIADNSKFKSADEPFDAYATEWKWGVGKKSLRGRLYAIKDGKEAGEFWEYRVFWHPKEGRAVFEQWGAGGVFGTGEMRVIVTADGKSENNVELTFYAPGGLSWRDLHKLWEAPGEHTTTSFDFKDGGWKAGRTYVWKRKG